jgi:hypothetical protein
LVSSLELLNRVLLVEVVVAFVVAVVVVVVVGL